MKDLLTLGRGVVPEDRVNTPPEMFGEAEFAYVETIIYADPDEILAMLRTLKAENFIGLPSWARNLAYRIVCLQRPDDAVVLREAADDLLAFGDWDEIAEGLQAEADRLDPPGPSGNPSQG
ncbi:hypothetical protein [Streptomyces sp. RerS4]|uniref:hypothetical protein n=1 Tax=Streptomyces sp. RerS4 TaxID=2942449 RepID=UPI00201BA846|nr:hypothetical protein [Streptomyces sp. RerS4]UQX03054.1 hypothetical protein M4D82_23075 [Streptomyces sp. RerS4]